jgi:formylglycine-generating enzyme
MRNRATATALSLGALVLWTGLATQAAAPVITNITMVGATPRFGVRSDLGITNQIQYCTNLSQATWVALTNLLVAQSPYWFVDVAAPPASQRFYRVAALAASTPSSAGMVLIPGGAFTMGNCMNTNNEGYPAELPLHTVFVSAFSMDTNLVSYAQWQQVYQWAATNSYSFDSAGSGKASTHPVQNINWYDVAKWCNARSQKEGLTPCYYTDSGLALVYRTSQVDPYVKWTANGYRLPTEAEWEKAARGGASGHRFPWSNVDTITHSQANYLSDSSYSYDISPTRGYHPTFATGPPYVYTSPVGYFAANGYGLCDMAGNVRQWCWDWYANTYYSSSPGTDPRGPTFGSYRVLRGGSWGDFADDARCASRTYYDYPWSANEYIGFRCVRGF